MFCRYCMSALIRLTEHVMSAQDTGSFLSITFGSVLVHVKRNYDKYMQNQEKSIQDARLPRKSAKCGIIPFVANFEVSLPVIRFQISNCLFDEDRISGICYYS